MKSKRIHSCNVLDSRPAERHLWHFKVERDQLKLQKEQTVSPADPLPEELAVKDWRNLYQPKVNVAWLPPGKVFLRVVQLPAADYKELLSMLEFQLEKLSPLPVTHVLWSVEVLPSAAEKMQTAVVCIVARDAVESFLGELEQRNYQPDRVEVPQLNQILGDGIREDGAWIYLSGEQPDYCTVAWWAGGTLQEIQLLHLPGPPARAAEGEEEAPKVGANELTSIRARFLQEQLMQIAWAGELEGWLTLPVRWRLVADPATAAEWEPLVREWSEEGVETAPPMTKEALARFSAGRMQKQAEGANLLPVEFGAKYRQQYVDRLWMRGVGAVIGLYAVGVVIYIIALQVFSYRQAQVEAQVRGIANTYTNVLRLKEQMEVLQDQLNLKYAALDSWKVASELLPEDFTLNWLVVSRGQALELHGTAPPDQNTKVTEYNEAIRNATINGEKVFSFVTGANIQNRPGSTVQTWQFRADLNLAETP